MTSTFNGPLDFKDLQKICVEEKRDHDKRQTKKNGLEGLKVQRIDGVNYFTFDLGYDLVHLQNLARSIPIRPDDVITIGFPRSGNHWTFEVVNMILSQSLDFHKDHFYSRLIECNGINVAENLDKFESPRNLTTHCRIHNIPLQAIQNRTKLIYVLRNPKDVLVSLYKFCSNLAHEKSRFLGSWDEFFELQMQGEFPYGYWFDHVLATESFRITHPECKVFILVFEKMKQDPVGQIRELCAFLDMPDTLSEQISRVTEFAHMKSVLSTTKLAVQSSKHFKNGPGDILRKGTVGDWKNWFTVSQNQEFNDLFHAKMADSELADLVREYI